MGSTVQYRQVQQRGKYVQLRCRFALARHQVEQGAASRHVSLFCHSMSSGLQSGTALSNVANNLLSEGTSADGNSNAFCNPTQHVFKSVDKSRVCTYVRNSCC